jgi:hypothetical protein
MQERILSGQFQWSSPFMVTPESRFRPPAGVAMTREDMVLAMQRDVFQWAKSGVLLATDSSVASGAQAAASLRARTPACTAPPTRSALTHATHNRTVARSLSAGSVSRQGRHLQLPL